MRLFYRSWNVPTPRAVCILVHGLGEHSGRYEKLAEALNGRGFDVQAMDHRGHGRSEGRRGDCRSVADFVEDLHRFIEKIRTEKQDAPRILIGHSLGGLIALYYAVGHPEMIRAVAVSSPALGIAMDLPKLKVAIAETLARVLPATPIPNGVDPQFLSRDAGIVSAYRADPLVHRAVTARCAIALRQAIADSAKLANLLQVPCLILQAGKDRICDPEASRRFATAVQKAPVTFHRYDELYHEVFNEPERDRVIQDLYAWIQETLS